MRRRASASFGLVESTFDAYADIDKHSHDQAYVSFLLRGSYAECGAARSYQCSTGSVIFHPAGDEHANRFDQCGGYLLNLQLDPSWLARLAEGLGREVGETIPLSPTCFRIGLELHAGFDSFSWRQVDQLAIELIAALNLASQLPTPPKWFSDSLELVETSIRNGQPLSLRETAVRCEVHPVHLSRCYSRFVGMNFSRYVSQTRVKQAFPILLQTDAPIVEVAFACGFADHAHFCRTFRAAVGLTPTAFRSRFARI